MITKEIVNETLKKIEDPEIRIDIVTLGLVYNVEVNDNNVNIRMTLTTPACPYGPWLIEDVKKKLIEAGANQVNVEVVFDPPWQASEELRALLGA